MATNPFQSPSSSSGPPSIWWLASTWKGERSLQEVCEPREESSQAGTSWASKPRGSVGLYLLYASWNKIPSGSTGLWRLLEDMLHPQSRLDVEYATGRIQVDASEDDLDLFCEESASIPSPPSQLPVLVLVWKTKTMKKPQIKFLTTPSPKQILLCCRRRTTPAFAFGEKPDDDSVDRQELQSILQSYGLATPIQKKRAAATLSSSSLLPTNDKALRIFIAGDRMSVGKTSVCLGLLGSLIAQGYSASSLAYIKPATQNEQPQMVQKYCQHMGIPCVPIGPVVYYRGFTRAFLAGETESSEDLLIKVAEAVDSLAEGKQVVIVDGVGFPAVGSICGTDNAQVASASGYPLIGDDDPKDQQDKSKARILHRRQPPGVLIVGGSGVGSAVDAFHMNATYFEKARVPVLGAIFNKLKLEGFYSLENCKEQINRYFAQNSHQIQLDRKAFGFVPLFSKLANDAAMEDVLEFIRIFQKHVDMDEILSAARNVQHQSFPMEMEIEEEEARVQSTGDIRLSKNDASWSNENSELKERQRNTIVLWSSPVVMLE